MSDPEKVEASRRHARAALGAYRAAVAHDGPLVASPDDGEAIVDLIVDLLHLADSPTPADSAIGHYLAEA